MPAMDMKAMAVDHEDLPNGHADAWPSLPDAFRAGIMAMIDAARRS